MGDPFSSTDGSGSFSPGASPSRNGSQTSRGGKGPLAVVERDKLCCAYRLPHRHVQNAETARSNDRRVPLAQACGNAEGHCPLHHRLHQAPATQIRIQIRPSRGGISSGEQPPKHTKLERIPHFQGVQRCKRELRAGSGEPGLGWPGIRVDDVTRDQKTAVRIVVHPLQNAASSRSTRTRFGSTRSPKMRLARASTSGHFTRRALLSYWAGISSASARTARTNFRRSRGGRAPTCLRSSTALMGVNLEGPAEAVNPLRCRDDWFTLARK